MIYENVNSRLLSGARKLANVVGCTMGPKGENVIINRLSGDPIITKDGVTVARNVELEDNVENIAVRIIKEVALRTVEEAGDGTTTATVLAAAIFQLGKEYLSDNPTVSVNELKRFYEMLTDDVVEALTEMRVEITADNEHLLRKVAVISANNDDALGGIIYEAIQSVGLDGIVKVVKSANEKTKVEVLQGLGNNNGYLNPYFAEGYGASSTRVEYENVKVALFDKKLESLPEVANALKSVNESTPILFIASDYSEDVISMLVTNNAQRSRIICAIRAPEFGDFRKAVIRDYSLYTGAKICTVSDGFKHPSNLGDLSKIMVTKKDHTLFATDENLARMKEELPEYLTKLNNLLDECEDDFTANKLKNRIAKLSGNVALIFVGAKTELEMQEKLDRVEDSLLATQAAVKGGILPGGGIAIPKVAHQIFMLNEERLATFKSSELDMLVYYTKAICSPFEKIMSNAGFVGDHIEDVLNFLLTDEKGNSFSGLNIATYKYVVGSQVVSQDLLEEGVIDPYLVTVSALKNAVSVASLLLTTNNVVEHFDEKTPYFGGEGA